MRVTRGPETSPEPFPAPALRHPSSCGAVSDRRMTALIVGLGLLIFVVPFAALLIV